MSLPWEAGRFKKSPVDPEHNLYERNRARDTYRRQLNLFNIRLEAWLKEYTVFDFDAKQEVRIKARRLRDNCLSTYKQSLQGLATTSHRREYTDVFLGRREANFEMHDPVVLDYELRLTSELDAIIANINLLNADLSNKATIDWMASLAKQRYSYEVETEEEPTYRLHDIEAEVDDDDKLPEEEDVDIALINLEYGHTDLI